MAHPYPHNHSGYPTLPQKGATPPAPATSAHTIARDCYYGFGNPTLYAYLTAADCTGANTPTASYNTRNQVTFVSQAAPVAYSAAAGFIYDAAGDVTRDGGNQYLYDAEGRICAVYNGNTSAYTGYLYNADGLRVASGSLTALSCNLASNGFVLKKQYLLNAAGEQVTELDGSGNWQHSNVWAGAHLDATYDLKGLHFHLADPLGTRRIQTNVLGQVESSFQSLPFGDGFASLPTALATADDATENHFTAKERDAESGNDYFFARYYNSAMGRFMSPDWSAKIEPVPYSKLDDPQTLNLYAYVGNNPLSRTDPDGHLQEDKHGKVKFHATGTGVGKWSFTDSKGNKVTITQKYKTGTVTTDDGHQVAAQKASGKMNVSITNSDGKTIGKGMSGLNAELGPGWSAQADCHGTTFAHGQLWINNDQVPSILSGDGYHSTTTPGVGDVGIYSRGDAVTPGSVDHSVRVSGTDANGDVTSVTSKGGITPKVETTPSGGWSDQSDSLTYYTQTKP